MLRVRVRYVDPASLVDDFEHQFQKGGLLLRAECTAVVNRFDPVALELVTSVGSIELAAEVVQVVPRVGLALSFDATDARLVAAVEEARQIGSTGGGSAIHEFVAQSGAVCERESDSASGPAAAGNNPAEKIHQAKHGNKEERMRIMRDGDRSLHRYVLRNPGLRLDEVTFIAKMTAVSVDLLKAIAERRDWAQRPEVALALVRNPKTPVPLAIQMLNHVAPSELRRMAKGGSLRMPILQAARKKVVGG